MVSFDVTSLFTNVPLSETIQIISDDIYSQDKSLHPPIPKNIFVKLLQLATQGMFSYRGKLFKQIDGVAMGSPLGLTLANYFMGNLEKNIFKSRLSNHPVMYLRYIDDIFAVFTNDDSCSQFFDLLNSQHSNINFTCQKAASSISFLDVKITVNDKDTDTFVSRKPTNTGLLLNFNAFCPSRWKSGLILCMLQPRAKMICSIDSLFLNEVNILRSIFGKNGYPLWFFNKVFHYFQSCTNEPKSINHSELKYFLKLPYFGMPSQRFAKKLSTLVLSKFNVKISPIYSAFKVGRIFQIKDKTPLPLCSNVVYQFTCSCDASKS